MKKLLVFIATAGAVIFVFFRQWFLSGEIIGGDWPYFYTEFLKSLPSLVPSWASYQGNGLGGVPIVYPLDSYLYAISAIFVRMMQIPWSVVYKFSYFGLFIAGSLYSAYYFIHALYPRVKTLQWVIALVIYSTNSYILMVTGGGQMGVALAYAFVPWALGSWIKLIRDVMYEKRYFLPQSLLTGMSFAVVILFDARIAYLIAIAVLLYFGVYVMDYVSLYANRAGFRFRFVLKVLAYVFGLPVLISLFLHASWILPMLVYKVTPLDNLVTNYTSTGAFIFHSFATFSNGISLLHPNWPENIFGKVYFLQPEFLILPILAFSSLLFSVIRRSSKQIVSSKQQAASSKDKMNTHSINYQLLTTNFHLPTTIYFFSLLALLGIFLAKGVNEPFGFVNIWLYEKVPGFMLFRDPTKFYLYIILSYSVLIPFTLQQFSELLSSQKLAVSSKGKLKSFLTTDYFLHSTFKYLLFIFFLVFWLVLYRQAVFGQLGGTFKGRQIPDEYIRLKDALVADKTFFRTLWMPRQPRFAFYSNTHPSVEAVPLFQATNSGELRRNMNKPGFADRLKSLSIQYVIVPFDPNGEIFTKDRTYDDGQRQDVVRYLDTMSWLVRDDAFQNLAVYKVADPWGKFQTEGNGIIIDKSIPYRELNTTHYRVPVSIEKPVTLVFSESYSPYWQAVSEGERMQSRSTAFGLNSFYLDKVGTYTVDITFVEQNVYNYGSIVSFGVIILLSGYYCNRFIQRKRSKKYAN